ncbi:hypothetical protein C5706_32955, partial [Klebsiella pneumoniae]
ATPIDLLLCRIQFKEMRHQGVFTPPGEDRSLQFPGSLGGMNWGSDTDRPAAVPYSVQRDAPSGRLYPAR